MIWFAYIVRCQDGTFYTGTTNNVGKRIQAHNSGRGAKYINAKRRPVILVHQEQFNSKSEALSREAAIKKLRKAEKEALISPIKTTP